MINFFRKIRRQLLDDNKSVKYIRYAIGEILLVVIGILIALQVNSWNETKQEERLAREYLKSLRSDLVKDTTNIQNLYPTIQYWIEDWNQFKRKTENPKLTEKSLIQLAQYEFDPSRPLPSTYNKTTFTTLLSTGHIRLIPVQLVEDILNYYALKEANQAEQITRESVYQSTLSSFTEKYAFEAIEHLQDGPLIQELIWNDVDPKDLAPRLSRLIKIKGGILSIKKTELDSLLSKGTELIEKLDSHLAH